jgi:hypothetical protein
MNYLNVIGFNVTVSCSVFLDIIVLLWLNSGLSPKGFQGPLRHMQRALVLTTTRRPFFFLSDTTSNGFFGHQHALASAGPSCRAKVERRREHRRRPVDSRLLAFDVSQPEFLIRKSSVGPRWPSQKKSNN